MSTQQYHLSLPIKYKQSNKQVKKIDMCNLAIHIGALGAIHIWKHLEIDHYQIALPAIFCLFLCFIVANFFRVRRIEENMAMMILEGVDLEEKKFFSRGFFS